MHIDISTVVGAAVLVTGLGLQVLATLRVRKDAGSTSQQKGLQLRLIWLVPILGAALVLAVLHDDRPARESSRMAEAGRASTSGKRA